MAPSGRTSGEECSIWKEKMDILAWKVVHGSIFEGAGETMVADQLPGGEGQEPPHRSAKEDRGGVRKMFNTLGVSFKRQVRISSMTTAAELYRNVA